MSFHSSQYSYYILSQYWQCYALIKIYFMILILSIFFAILYRKNYIMQRIFNHSAFSLWDYYEHSFGFKMENDWNVWVAFRERSMENSIGFLDKILCDLHCLRRIISIWGIRGAISRNFPLKRPLFSFPSFNLKLITVNSISASTKSLNESQISLALFKI